MKISIIFPTRRPQQALRTQAWWLERASGQVELEWIFAIDEDDPASLALFTHHSSPIAFTISKPGGGCVRAVNDAAATATGDILLCGSDDIFAPQDWDRMVADGLRGVRAGVLGVRDGHRTDGLLTTQIVTRGWYQRFGYIFPPAFKSVYGDAWLTERAQRDGAIVPADPACVFEHRHPMFGTALMDDVYLRENSPERYAEGWQVLNELLPQRISLCIICGNEASVIIRCLDSAAGAFDELCLVRAIGGLTPDETVSLATRWCVENGKEFRFLEYRNQIGLAWPHLDDFAAARNLSFSLATGDWQLWLDCDDVLDDLNCRRIREAALTREYDALYCRYLIARDGAELERERLIRRGAGEWHGAVHEVCVINGTPAHCPQILIEHRPGDADRRLESARRNVAIIERATEDAGRLHFYLHADYKSLGRCDEAIRAGQAALVLLDPKQVEERYQVRLNLSELEPARQLEHLLEALRLQPHRREALAYLCQICLRDGDVSGATSWFRMLDALPLPSPVPWTHQGIWYPDASGKPGWARNLLRVRILHAAGNSALATTEHQTNLADPAYAAAAVEFGGLTGPAGCEPTIARDNALPPGNGKEPGNAGVHLGGQRLPLRPQ